MVLHRVPREAEHTGKRRRDYRNVRERHLVDGVLRCLGKRAGARKWERAQFNV